MHFSPIKDKIEFWDNFAEEKKQNATNFGTVSYAPIIWMILCLATFKHSSYWIELCKSKDELFNTNIFINDE